MASSKEKKDEKKDGETITVAKTPADLQRMRLAKLMNNPTKPVFIPDSSRGPRMKEPPEFIRNVWGSSAGAGSGDFHVYRGVRRREYARQKFTNEVSQKKSLDEEYHIKVEENQKEADKRTAKKRAKRQKKKKSKKMKKDDSSDSEEEQEKGKKMKEAGKNRDNGHRGDSKGRPADTDSDVKDES